VSYKRLIYNVVPKGPCSYKDPSLCFGVSEKKLRRDVSQMHYLLKTEPSEYNFADLQKSDTTIWDGVSNPVALKHLRGMEKGNKLVIYHTGDERAAVGTATVESADPSDPRNPRVKIKAGKAIAKPRTLAEIKSSKLFAESPLVRQGRLSVVPLTQQQYDWLIG
jgi:predicted RNA-binding protein with PUA-like domain